MLVLVRFKNGKLYLFKAPKYSSISEKDLVICETREGEATGTVVATLDGWYAKEKEVKNFVVTACEATEPLKRIISVAHYKELPWSDEDEDSEEL